MVASDSGGAYASYLASVGMSIESVDDVFAYRWRGDFDNDEVNCLHAEGFEHPLLQIDWRAQLDRHSLGWVCARRQDQLVGFLNVAWDGDAHAFVLDTVVTSAARHAGVGTELVSVATKQARAADANGYTSTSTNNSAASTLTLAASRRPKPG